MHKAQTHPPLTQNPQRLCKAAYIRANGDLLQEVVELVPGADEQGLKHGRFETWAGGFL